MKKDESKSDNQSGAHLMKKFTKSVSTSEIKNIAEKIVDADPDIDKVKLEEAKNQFHREKKEDAAKQAENDAEFKQPES
jgi:hypothetical protein